MLKGIIFIGKTVYLGGMIVLVKKVTHKIIDVLRNKFYFKCSEKNRINIESTVYRIDDTRSVNLLDLYEYGTKKQVIDMFELRLKLIEIWLDSSFKKLKALIA